MYVNMQSRTVNSINMFTYMDRICMDICFANIYIYLYIYK